MSRVETTPQQDDTIERATRQHGCVKVDQAVPMGVGAIIVTPWKPCVPCDGHGCSRCDSEGGFPTSQAMRVLPDGQVTAPDPWLGVCRGDTRGQVLGRA
jgi:hypothetical protein